MSIVTFDSKGIIVSINIPWVPASCVQVAIMQLNSAMVCMSESFSSMAKVINDLAVVHENVYPILKDKEHENVYPILKDKEHEKYGWYRKFEKKRF